MPPNAAPGRGKDAGSNDEHPPHELVPREPPVSPARQRGPRSLLAVLVVISAGGAIGALARWSIDTAWSSAASAGFPVSTLLVNVLGGLLIGVLMVLVSDHRVGGPLLRPFVGVGILGGFTTFSTYVIEIQQLVDAGAPVRALGYLGGTVGAVLLATFIGVVSTRWLRAVTGGRA